MRRAIDLAQRAWGRTHPNPMVGAVLVEDGQVTAEGFHEKDGGPHAERIALSSLMRNPIPGATLYVTLEPCSTAGRTGACTDAILSAGIRRVVVGAVDPNPAHAGKGLDILRAAGIEVVTGVLGEECADLNLIYNHWIAKGRPSSQESSRRRSTDGSRPARGIPSGSPATLRARTSTAGEGSSPRSRSAQARSSPTTPGSPHGATGRRRSARSASFSTGACARSSTGACLTSTRTPSLQGRWS